MVIKGFIKEMGQTREWTDKNGVNQQSVKLTLGIPSISKDGKEFCEELMGEFTLPNQSNEHRESLQRTCSAQEKCEFHVGFYLSEWQGKKIQNIRIYGMNKLMI